jgi:hypothetical protein
VTSAGQHLKKCEVDRRPKVHIQLNTTMRNTLTGQPLEVKSRHDLFAPVKVSLARVPGYEQIDDDVMLAFARYVAADDMAQFSCVAALLDPAAKWDGAACQGKDKCRHTQLDDEPARRMRLASLAWTAVASHMSQFSNHGATMDLPYEVPAYIRPDQLVLTSTANGKLAARVSDVSGLDPILYKATLSFKSLPAGMDQPNSKARTLIYADSLTLDPQSHTLTAMFPTFTVGNIRSTEISNIDKMFIEPVWTEEQTFERTVWHPTAAELNSQSDSVSAAEKLSQQQPQGTENKPPDHRERRPFIFTKFAASGVDPAADAGAPGSFTRPTGTSKMWEDQAVSGNLSTVSSVSSNRLPPPGPSAPL